MARKGRSAPGVSLVWPGKESELAVPDAVRPDDLRIVERVEPEHWGVEAPSPPEPTSNWRNTLVYGDNLLAMHTLGERVQGRVELIYIDPPFATGLNYFSQKGRGQASMQHRAYSDMLSGGMAGYADAMFRRLRAMRELLCDNGKIFVHCDWRANAVLRLILDEVFGADCFRNEIIWRRAPNLGRQAASKQLGRVIDSIFVYSKTTGALFPGPVPKRRALVPLDSKGKPKGSRWDEERELYFTTAPRGDYTDKSIERLRGEGRIYDSPAGKVYIKYFLTKGRDGRWYKEQPVDTLWDDYDVRPLRHRPKSEAMGYDTQKPEGLLERIISWSSKPGDIVADFFCGSGTTLAVAERLGRRWVGADQQRPAIEISRKRLGDLGARFDIGSVLNGERRLWTGAQTEHAPQHDAVVVLDAYGATPFPDAPPERRRWGQIGDATVVVHSGVEPMSEREVLQICEEVARDGALAKPGLYGAGPPNVEEFDVVVLAWAWSAHDARSVRRRAKREHSVNLSMCTVPIELVRGAKKLPFLERTEVDLEVIPDGGARRLSVRITDAWCDDPSRLREDKSNKGNKHETTELTWADYIDSWRVDFGTGANEGPGEQTPAFTASWQAVRAKDELALQSPPHDFDSNSRVKVKIFTVFGDEVDRTIRIECGS